MSRQYFPLPVYDGEEGQDEDKWCVLICDYDDEREGFFLAKDIHPEVVITGTYDECFSYLDEKVDDGKVLIEADE